VKGEKVETGIRTGAEHSRPIEFEWGRERPSPPKKTVDKSRQKADAGLETGHGVCVGR